ncbi:MAG: GDSL-type esterase/lipase family protein [Candidatus Pacebacteria bacterium]|jgi:lysophospholipase L1-like esterase|nr:GDSL-type esterase/lipase family protein [Candidatus Paceibacterota bacterium]
MHTNIYILGDSVAFGEGMSQGGWPQLLNSFLIERYAGGGAKEFRVYNLSVGSERTREVLARMDAELLARGAAGHENVIVFAVGLNDSAFVHSANTNWIDFAEFTENVKKLIDSAKKYSDKVIFIGLTPADYAIVDPMPWDTDKSYREADVKRYDAALKEVSGDCGAGYIPVYNEFVAAGSRNLLLDGAHPNSAGHKLIFEIVRDYLIGNKIF